jgi:hypothetical protein
MQGCIQTVCLFFLDKKSPNTVQKSPNTVQRSPNAVQRSPNTVQKSPNTVQKSPKCAITIQKILAKTLSAILGDFFICAQKHWAILAVKILPKWRNHAQSGHTAFKQIANL